MSLHPDTPVEAGDLLWALASLCGVQRVPFDARMVLQQFPPPLCIATLFHAASALGLRISQRPVPFRDLKHAVLPVLALRRDGAGARLAIVLSADAETALVAERDIAPHDVPLREFAGRYEADVLLAAPAGEGSARDPALTDHPFGLRWFIPELLRHKAVWREVLAASLVLQLVALVVPLFTQVVIDKVVVHHSSSTLAVILSALAIFVAFSAALSYARQYLLLHTGNRIDAVLGMRSFEHLLRLPPRYFETRPTGTLVARLRGVETIREFITGAAASLLLDVPFLVVFLAVMFWYSVPLTLIAAALIGVLAAASLAVTPLLRRRINDQFLIGARNQAFVTEHVAAMETVKALQMEPQVAARFGRNLADHLRASFATRQLANSYGVLASGVEQTLSVAVLGAGAWMVMTLQEFTIGMLVAFQMFAGRLAQPALRLAGLWQEFQQTAIAVQRLGDLMDAPAELYSLNPARARDHGRENAGRIVIDDVTFRYRDDQAPVYENFSLTIEPGSCVALTGPSGSGKSTLARLLQGFYLPAAGAVRIDGRDTRHLSANELRLNFGVVPQETRLFSGTLFENLIAAQPHAGIAEVADACRQAEIHDFIEGLPEGYRTLVGENGVGLSGGQKQRIAIARALLRRPRILIFDEATASLDRDTAEAFARTVSRLRGSATVLFIAHQVPESLAVDMVARIDPRATGIGRLDAQKARTGA
ncbi:MAG TPA: peptidase domain-containing ABC transporter [Burkholderiales bacterium]|nr:peptidase domain-containing ABC transporter [Burkholderiales bacterium]